MFGRIAKEYAGKIKDTVDEAVAKPLYKAVTGRDMTAGKAAKSGEETAGVHARRKRAAAGLRDSLKRDDTPGYGS